MFLPSKFSLRIAPLRRVALRLDAVLVIEELGVLPERLVDFLLRPNVKRAFRFFRPAGGFVRLSASSAE